MSYGFNISLGAALPGFFHCCYFRRWHLGGASVLRRSCLHAQPHHWNLTSASISPWSPYFKWKCKSLAICFTYGARVAGCLFESSSIFILPAPTQPVVWILRFNSHCCNTRISNYTGTASDEQDEFAMSLWPCHCQTSLGKHAYLVFEWWIKGQWPEWFKDGDKLLLLNEKNCFNDKAHFYLIFRFN